ncbi:MAG: hypothetical protein M0Z82_05775 [Actinomycetota bacterium]|nr:hypothetical protein [Actinomycetota bacterium]
MSARHSSPRRRRLVLRVALGVAATAMVSCGSSSASTHPSGTSTRRAPHHGGRAVPSTVTVHMPPWALPNPLSRMVVLDGGPGQLTILGGLTAGDTSANGVFRLDLADGQLTAVSTLPDAVHDAAGAQLAGRDLVIGGGSTSTIAAVQGVPTGGGAATVLAQLPQPRSDDSATMVGSTAVIAGGYDGTVADPAVLTTTDGTSFTTVGSLPVPVRYTTLAAIGHDVYAFGGLAVSGPGAGLPVADVQRIDIQNGSAAVVAQLPQPLEGASAFVLGGRIFVAGGDTARASTGALTSSSTIWAFHQAATTGSVATSRRGARRSAFSAAGTLGEAVSNAGVAVAGSTAWLIGGEHDGTPVTAVQQIRATN